MVSTFIVNIIRGFKKLLIWLPVKIQVKTKKGTLIKWTEIQK